MTNSDKKTEASSEVEKEVSNNNAEEKIEETIEDKLKITQDKLLRTMAEMENQRRRFEKEKNEAFEFGGFNFASESLLLLDNIERAIISFKNDEKLKNNKDLKTIIEGVEIVKNDLISIFKKNGIVPIECINKKFDPTFHQAMLEIETDTKESGIVVQEIQKGYLMKERLLRASMVGVTKKVKKNDEKTANDIKNDEK